MDPLIEQERDETLTELVAVRMTARQVARVDKIAYAHDRGRSYVIRVLVDEPLKRCSEEMDV